MITPPIETSALIAARTRCGWPGRTRVALSDERGVTLLEMALVLPVFFLLLFGLFNFSIAFFGYANATFAARAGARYASLHSGSSLAPADATTIKNIVTPYLYAAPSSGVTISTAYSPGSNSHTFSAGNTVGSNVTVSVTIVYPVGIPFSSLRQITVGSSAQRAIAR